MVLRARSTGLRSERSTPVVRAAGGPGSAGPPHIYHGRCVRSRLLYAHVISKKAIRNRVRQSVLEKPDGLNPVNKWLPIFRCVEKK